MKWADIPDAAKMAATVVVAVFGVIGYLTTFQTDAEAAEMEQRVSKTLNDVRLDNIDAQIDGYEFQLLEPDMAQEKREWIKHKIDKLENKKVCIRKGEC